MKVHIYMFIWRPNVGMECLIQETRSPEARVHWPFQLMTCHLALGFTGSASHVTTGRSPCTPGVPEVSRDSNSVPPLV